MKIYGSRHIYNFLFNLFTLNYFETIICSKNNWWFTWLFCVCAWILMSFYSALASHSPWYITFLFLFSFLSTRPWMLSKWEIKMVKLAKFMLHPICRWRMSASSSSTFSVTPTFAVGSRWLSIWPHGEVKPCVTLGHHPSLGLYQIPSRCCLHSVFLHTATSLYFWLCHSPAQSLQSSPLPSELFSSAQHFGAFLSLIPAHLSFLLSNSHYSITHPTRPASAHVCF